MQDLHTDDRGRVQITDVVLTLVVLVGLIAVAPFFYKFTGMVASEADPFTSLVLQLVVPLLFLGVIVSVGASARRAG
jgi:hypothetical protein